MKFWKILNLLLAAIFPEWREMFLSYKLLKQDLKIKYPNPAADEPPPPKRQKVAGGDEEAAGESDENDDLVADFVRLLENEIRKFNKFFCHKEEHFIIDCRVLKDKIAEVKDSREDLSKVGKKLVDLHGEMILLQTYSILNYTGLVKITKKHDKRSGALIRLSFIQTVLDQPFFRIDVVNQLVRECETMLNNVFANNNMGETNHLESKYKDLIILAFRVLGEIRKGSSTVGPHSLPPMDVGEELEALFAAAEIYP